MMSYVIFPIHVNFANRSRCVLKAITHRKKNSGLFYVTWEIFFSMLLMIFQSMLAPVHCCPASHNWTHEPTLNKKNQDSLVMLCLVKKQATRHLKLQPVFGQKHVCLLLGTTLHVVFLCNIVSDIFGQNRLDNILMQWCPRMVDAALYRLFTLICQGPTLPK